MQTVDTVTGDHDVLMMPKDAQTNSKAKPTGATVKQIAVCTHAPVSAPPFYKVGSKLFKTDNNDAPQLKKGMYTITSLELLYTARVKHFVEADDNVKESISKQLVDLVKKFTSVPLKIEHIFTKSVKFQFEEQTQSGHREVITEILAANRGKQLSTKYPDLIKQYPDIQQGTELF